MGILKSCISVFYLFNVCSAVVCFNYPVLNLGPECLCVLYINLHLFYFLTKYLTDNEQISVGCANNMCLLFY